MILEVIGECWFWMIFEVKPIGGGEGTLLRWPHSWPRERGRQNRSDRRQILSRAADFHILGVGGRAGKRLFRGRRKSKGWGARVPLSPLGPPLAPTAPAPTSYCREQFKDLGLLGTQLKRAHTPIERALFVTERAANHKFLLSPPENILWPQVTINLTWPKNASNIFVDIEAGYLTPGDIGSRFKLGKGGRPFQVIYFQSTP